MSFFRNRPPQGGSIRVMTAMNPSMTARATNIICSHQHRHNGCINGGQQWKHFTCAECGWNKKSLGLPFLREREHKAVTGYGGVYEYERKIVDIYNYILIYIVCMYMCMDIFVYK